MEFLAGSPAPTPVAAALLIAATLFLTCVDFTAPGRTRYVGVLVAIPALAFRDELRGLPPGVLVALGLVLGLARLSPVGLVIAVAAASDPVSTAGFVVPLAVGWFLRETVSGRRSPAAWVNRAFGYVGCALGLLPLVLVFAVPLPDASGWQWVARVLGALLMGKLLFDHEVDRWGVLRGRRHGLRAVEIGLVLMGFAVAAGPIGARVVEWWGITTWGLVPLVYFLAAYAAHRVVRKLRVRFLELCTTCASAAIRGALWLPFLLVGLTQPAHFGLGSAVLYLFVGVVVSPLERHELRSKRHLADLKRLLRADEAEREAALGRWAEDMVGRPYFFTYHLPNLAAGVAIGASAGAHPQFAPEEVPGLLAIARDALDAIGRATPPSYQTRGEQFGARGDHARHVAHVCENLGQTQGRLDAAEEAAEWYGELEVPAATTVALVEAAAAALDLDRPDHAADLLDRVPSDLPPPVDRYVTVFRAHLAARGGDLDEARRLVGLLPAYDAKALIRALAAERLPYGPDLSELLPRIVESEVGLRQLGVA
ncbi:hypothetical protein GCM10022243_36670 [Saccharothrix violaceirubra]|uniref:Uncharacterized protein n=1 Tax=Saccharothrix violaceirubra TaxID=413306 RepID=A0A7W7T5N2_9PSEU|nr:hypothetical protein [Saccharothrix violaceirubra]MBB4966417.1 hypothetical protein [Saccharothrix violaceirubra]